MMIFFLLNSLIQEVIEAYEALEPTKVARAIQSFAVDDLSNWHVRQSRRRFWKGEMSDDKLSAYQTLHTCLKLLAVMIVKFESVTMSFAYFVFSIGNGR